MTYSQNLQFTSDTDLLQLPDSQTAMRFHHEYVVRHSARIRPRFFEVDRSPGQIDGLWHSHISARLKFTRRSYLELPAINRFSNQKWVNSKFGRYAGRDDFFWVSRLSLQQHDYFPESGDVVYWNGYRNEIVKVSIPEDAYFTQTGVWLGLVCECMIAPLGDARPPSDLSKPAPSEISEGPSPEKRSDERPGHIANPLGPQTFLPFPDIL